MRKYYKKKEQKKQDKNVILKKIFSFVRLQDWRANVFQNKSHVKPCETDN